MRLSIRNNLNTPFWVMHNPKIFRRVVIKAKDMLKNVVRSPSSREDMRNTLEPEPSF